jgi:hypothetical protein
MRDVIEDGSRAAESAGQWVWDEVKSAAAGLRDEVEGVRRRLAPRPPSRAARVRARLGQIVGPTVVGVGIAFVVALFGRAVRRRAG